MHFEQLEKISWDEFVHFGISKRTLCGRKYSDTAVERIDFDYTEVCKKCQKTWNKMVRLKR